MRPFAGFVGGLPRGYQVGRVHLLRPVAAPLTQFLVTGLSSPHTQPSSDFELEPANIPAALFSG